MKIGILCAMESEAKEIIKRYSLQKLDDSKFDLYGNDTLILLISRIGKIYAAAGTQYLIEHHEVDVVINAGLSGGVSSDLKIGDVYFASSVAQHDVYLPWDGEHLDYLKKAIDMKKEFSLSQKIENLAPWKNVLTGDQFVDDKKKAEELFQYGDIVEMEAFAVASICKLYAVECIIIKAISDTASDDAMEDFEENESTVALTTVPLLEQVIMRLTQ